MSGIPSREKSMRTLAFIIVCLISWPAQAFDATTGDMTCTNWLEARDELKSWVHSHRGKMPTGHNAGSGYLIGFIEGYDFACPLKKPRGSGLDTEAVFDRADDICKSKDGHTPLLLVAFDLVLWLDSQHSDVCSH
jgi:hypothetical protein